MRSQQLTGSAHASETMDGKICHNFETLRKTASHPVSELSDSVHHSVRLGHVAFWCLLALDRDDLYE